MRARLEVDQADGRTNALEVSGQSIRLGRGQDCDVAVDGVAFPKVSNIHARIDPSPDGFSLIHLSRSNGTLLNGAPVDGSAPIKAGDTVKLGFTGPAILVVAIEPSQDGSQAEGRFGATLQADVRHLALLRGTAATERFELGKGGIIGREQSVVQFQLDHPHVSRIHASLTVDGDRVVLADLGSSNGTFVNGVRLTRPSVLSVGDSIDIGPFSLGFDGSSLVSRSRSNNVELTARGLKRIVRDRATGQPLVLLDHISLVIRPKEFVCLLGPSGSGKSTLLAILSGRNPPDVGIVTLNGQDLYAHFAALKEDVAVVPQKDVLHDSLPLGAALRYTAELRLPRDTSRDELGTSVSDILAVVGLTTRRDTLIRHLSGGQVKRASLANELVARPSLLFLDEVTSGLDEQTDRDVMELFRQVAEGGKTVVCITHNLANVEATCHLVAILTEGGRLAFIGTPEEAKAYFRIPRLGEVYKTLTQAKPEEWHDRFRSSPLFQRYVVDRMPAGASSDPEGRVVAPPTARRAGSVVRQASVLTRRYLSIWKGERLALLALLAQSLLVAVLLALVFGDLAQISQPFERARRTQSLLFLLAVSCFWFGCNTAAKELVKERVIFLRERDFNLRVGSYLMSKFLVLVLIALAQTCLLYGIVWFWCGRAGMPVVQGATLGSLAVAGTSVGLLISALARSEEVATALVPIVVIPQIILGDVIAPLKGLVLWIGQAFVSVYWAQQALERSLPDADLSWLERETGPWVNPCSVVLLHASIGVLATVLVLLRSGRRTAGRRA
jgi:ABC transport system ATP-binding/permease protein